MSEFRQSVYGTLRERDIEKARALIRPRIVRNPDAFTPAAKHTLNITGEEIKAAQMERGDTREMTKEEKTEFERKKKQKQEDEQLQPLRPYIGTVLYDKGNDRLIHCIGFGKISRTRTKYDEKKYATVKTSSDVPCMEVRYFPRPKFGKSATAKKENGLIGPGEFLVRIQSGEYELRTDIALSQDTIEIDAKFFPKK